MRPVCKCGRQFELRCKINGKQYYRRKCRACGFIDKKAEMLRGILNDCVCAICGKGFKSHNPQAKYCSQKCRQIKYAEQRKQDKLRDEIKKTYGFFSESLVEQYSANRPKTIPR